MDEESCQIQTADGTLITFDRTRGPVHDAAVIICPGFFQDRRSPAHRRLAGILAEYCNVLCMDFRGHGDSVSLQTYSDCEDQDLEAVFRWAQNRYEKIGLIGFSLGAAAAIRLSARLGGVQTLVAVSAPSAFDDIEFKFWTAGGSQTDNPLLKKERPTDSIRKLSGVPILLIHGARDATILPVHSQRLYEAAPDPKRLLLIDDGGHAEELFRRAQEQFLPPLRDWIKTTLMGVTIQPGTVRHTEGYLPADGGISLYQQCWKKEDAAIPVVVLHGLGDHSGRWTDAAYRLARGGCAVYGFDLPGHGRSPGPRGHVDRFSDYLDCLRGFVLHVSELEQGKKPVLIGQGLGGLIAVLFAAEHPDLVDQLICSSPFWAPAGETPFWKQIPSQILSLVWPSAVIHRTQINGELLSHDTQAVFRYSSDPLVHFRTSVRLQWELEERFLALPSVLAMLRLPVLVLQAGDDRLVSVRGVKALFDRIGSGQKRFILYEGYFHDLFNEKGKERVFLDLQEWLKRGKIGEQGGTAHDR